MSRANLVLALRAALSEIEKALQAESESAA